MAIGEARQLLEGAGVGLPDAEVDELVGRTEGWPVGLYLAALALRAGAGSRQAGAGFTGEDRFLADYLRSELLARLSPEPVSFLTRTAVLDRMSGPLCDAVLGGTGSAACWRRWRAPTCWWSRWTAAGVVPLPPAVPGAAPGRAGAARARAGPASSTSGRPPGARPTGCPRPRSTMPWPPATPTGSPGWSRELAQPRLRRRAARHRPALVGLVRGPGADPALPAGRHAGGVAAGAGGPAGRAERWADAAEHRSSPGDAPRRQHRPRAGGRCCGPCCAATGASRCGPTRRPPWPG